MHDETSRACEECRALEAAVDEAPDPDEPRPTRWWHCECGAHLERWRGRGDQSCPDCSAWYNACGQRLRDDWADNPAWRDDEVDDLTGFELSQLAKEESL